MHYFLYPSKDSFVSNNPNFIFKNMGLDEILEVEKKTYNVAYQSTASGQYEVAYGAKNTSLSRALLHFDLSQISQSVSSGNITNPKFYLSLKTSEAREIPTAYTLAAYPLAKCWDMGTGYKYDGAGMADGVSWKYTDGITEKWWASEGLSNLDGGGIWYVSSSLIGSGSGYAQPPYISLNPYDPFPFCVTPTPTATVVPTATPIPTATPTETPTSTPTDTPVPTATPTSTIVPTATPTPTLDIEEVYLYNQSGQDYSFFVEFSSSLGSSGNINLGLISGSTPEIGLSFIPVPIGITDTVTITAIDTFLTSSIITLNYSVDTNEDVYINFLGLLNNPVFIASNINTPPFPTEPPTATPSSTPTSTPTDTPTSTPTDTPTATPSPTPSPSPSPTPTPTATSYPYFVTGSLACHQSFNYQTSDVYMDITTIVTAWLSNTIPNYGLIILHSGESDNVDYGKLRFFSKETNTVYSPYIDVSWDDSTFDTGSTEPINIQDAVVAVKNMTTEYKYGSIIRFNVTGRQRYPVKTFTNKLSDYLEPYYLPFDTFYSIRDMESADVVLPYDTNTRVSFDSTGNYFYLDTTGLPQERYFGISIRSEQSGSILTFDVPTSFKITR